jgi:hypothetical protein
MMDHKLLQ